MNSISTLPKHYNVDFIIAESGVANHYGYEIAEDEIVFRYQVSDYDAVVAAIESYPMAYRVVMVPTMIHAVSQTREARLQTFSFNGMTVPLDTVTIANLTASAVGLQRNPDRASINWSLGKGVFVTISRDALLALADAAFNYVNDCFDAQKAIVEEIQAAPDIEVLRQIDIANHEAWPA
ncbi:DUF4376 domain-containing protein [Brevundimonas sp. NPDC058933]|uniref:DUF4376 domain-containing protein n=1 Tax=Brevundimonas sp. NPDC058933 TaxID=3346673 RepID=UPI003BEF16D4